MREKNLLNKFSSFEIFEKIEKLRKKKDEFLPQKNTLLVAHTEWRQDGEDTESDADSEFELELKVYKTFDRR